MNSATNFNGHNMYYLFKTYDLFDSNPKSVTTTFFGSTKILIVLITIFYKFVKHEKSIIRIV